ncbi:MAG: hypothetical protein ACOX7P_04830 [Oscillospiraceae bacterium]|jgi:hypothetical protein
MDLVNLEVLSKDADRIIEALSSGNMVIARSGNEFLYVFDRDGEYLLFRHTPGFPGGGRKSFPKNEKGDAIVRNLAKIADRLYLAEFDGSMNIFGVMQSAEEGILSIFPGDDRSLDEDIEFIIPKKQ